MRQGLAGKFIEFRRVCRENKRLASLKRATESILLIYILAHAFTIEGRVHIENFFSIMDVRVKSKICSKKSLGVV